MARQKPAAGARANALQFEGHTIEPGGTKLVELPLMKLYSHTEITLPVKVFVGKERGPSVFLSAAVHGDEVNGVEIIRRFLKKSRLPGLKGTLFVVPVVNVHGLLHRSRYLPDRRDLNRHFPGSEKGSLASRVAYLFMTTIVDRCEFGIDLHSGSDSRTNLPQIRANLSDRKTKELAKAFGAPVILDSDLRDGSLRAAMVERGKKILLFEGGEALRFDEFVIRAGLKGVRSALRHIGSLPALKTKKVPLKPFVARSSTWVRAPDSGLFRASVKLGARVKKGEVIGYLNGPFGDTETPVKAKASGVIISRSNLPLINEGEALFHIARFDKTGEVAETVKEYQSLFEPNEE